MTYVLTKGSGWYVNHPGSAKSYTRNKAAAQRFRSEEEARRCACGNEWPVEL